MADPVMPLSYHDFALTNGTTSQSHFIENVGPSMTRQEFKDECDINVLMDRYLVHGMPLPDNSGEAMYVDWSAMPSDLMGALEAFDMAETAFMTLPAKVRDRFSNNPVDFVDFASDPKNLDQLREWGLAKPLEAPSFAPVPPPGANGVPASQGSPPVPPSGSAGVAPASSSAAPAAAPAP